LDGETLASELAVELRGLVVAAVRLVRLDLNAVKRRQKYVGLGLDASEFGELLSVLGEVTAVATF
jgi:hypothetical protein